MKPRTAAFVFVLLLVACGEAVPGSSTSLPTEPTTIPAGPTTTLAVDGVAVIVTATPVQQPDGSMELCPPGMTPACPGIILQGDMDLGLASSEETPTVAQVSGTYDGRALYPASKPVAVDYPPIAKYEFDSRCPDLRGTGSGQDPITEAVSSYADRQPDFAASWWDRKTAIFTVWFKGDATSHDTAIEAIAGDAPVCVVGGADFSLAELMEASHVITEFTERWNLPLTAFGYTVGGLSNRIDLELEAIDPEIRSAVSDQFGEKVAPHPFIELVDVPLADLPEPIPVIAGDVDVLTSGTRWGGGMAALGLFPATEYDAELNCVYLTDPDEGWRTVPVWPFGYAATSDPMIVFDYDGNAVVSEGEPIELGGGFVGVEFVEGNTCGADGAWIVNR